MTLKRKSISHQRIPLNVSHWAFKARGALQSREHIVLRAGPNVQTPVYVWQHSRLTLIWVYLEKSPVWTGGRHPCRHRYPCRWQRPCRACLAVWWLKPAELQRHRKKKALSIWKQHTPEKKTSWRCGEFSHVQGRKVPLCLKTPPTKIEGELWNVPQKAATQSRAHLS